MRKLPQGFGNHSGRQLRKRSDHRVEITPRLVRRYNPSKLPNQGGDASRVVESSEAIHNVREGHEVVFDILFDRLNGILRSMIGRKIRAPNVLWLDGPNRRPGARNSPSHPGKIPPIDCIILVIGNCCNRFSCRGFAALGAALTLKCGGANSPE